MKNILNFKPCMQYRRFGKTEEKLSVITLGGMRFKKGWDEPRTEIPSETLDHCLQTVQLAMEAGINHIETAWGYQKSESVFGQVLNRELRIPRTSYYLMTKGHAHTADEMKSMVEKQLRHLQTDYLDFYGWHGINNEELLQMSCKTGGPVETLLRLKEEGVIRHVGFSTHGATDLIIKTIETDLFEFVNLHYYYFNQQNLPAVKAANKADMGVFIISPNDKGGQLFKAPEKVRQATAPATPIQWNARFCLRNKEIHTLSFGITEPEHFEEMKGIFIDDFPWAESDEHSLKLLDSFTSHDPYAWFDGKQMSNDPSGINIPEVLRLRKLWKCYNMKEFGCYRYKVFEQKSHWFPGKMATPENVAKIDESKIPEGIPLKEMLTEAHREFYTTQLRIAKS